MSFDQIRKETGDELVARASTHEMEIEEFVPRGEIDPLYVIRPYYIVPDGKLGQDGFAIIREILRSMSRVAWHASP